MAGPGDPVDLIETTLTAAADGSYKSRVPISAEYVQVTAAATDANDWIILPTGIRPGHKVRGWSVVAHEIRTEASSNVKINDVDGDGSQEAAVAATTYWEATYVNSTQGWIIAAWTELGAALTLVTN